MTNSLFSMFIVQHEYDWQDSQHSHCQNLLFEILIFLGSAGKFSKMRSKFKALKNGGQCHNVQILVANRNQLPGLTRVKIHFYIIPPSILKSSKQPLSLKLLHHKPVCTSPLPHSWQMSCQPHPSWFDHSSNNHNKIIPSSLMILQKRMNYKWGDISTRKGGDLTASVEKERQVTCKHVDQYAMSSSRW